MPQQSLRLSARHKYDYKDIGRSFLEDYGTKAVVSF
jgi:hypothetical protein